LILVAPLIVFAVMGQTLFRFYRGDGNNFIYREGNLAVHFLDVGNGHCVIVQLPDGRVAKLDDTFHGFANRINRYIDARIGHQNFIYFWDTDAIEFLYGIAIINHYNQVFIIAGNADNVSKANFIEAWTRPADARIFLQTRRTNYLFVYHIRPELLITPEFIFEVGHVVVRGDGNAVHTFFGFENPRNLTPIWIIAILALYLVVFINYKPKRHNIL